MNKKDTAILLGSLERRLGEIGPLAVAVSGGIDSMLLAYVANRMAGTRVHMYHAQSPAVPKDALRRIWKYANKEKWQLTVIDAQEFADSNYIRNPVNRCYFCKSNLYHEIGKLTESRIVSGTNTDDLNDYRPGLVAARENRVCHPYVDVGISKQNIRDIANYLSLFDISDLPASPCLSSRVETGISIDAAKLAIIDEIENTIRKMVITRNVRLRFREYGASVEIDEKVLKELTNETKNGLLRVVDKKLKQCGYQCAVNIRPYNMGSAFRRTAVQ
jgi:uncharacterized protein